MTHIAIISSQRPGNVERMSELLGVPATWYVGEGEAAAYRDAGAETVVEAGGLIPARNAALTAADGAWCVQVSDDLRGLDSLDGPLTFTTTVKILIRAAEGSAAKLAGVAPTSNRFYAARKVNHGGFIVGDLIAVAPGSRPRFDPKLRLKEDYDFTCQHLMAHGSVARCDWVLANFAHRTNKGGAVAYRDAALEAETCAYLLGKWPGMLRPHPRRENELVLRWPPVGSR